MGLGKNSRQIFESAALTRKIFRNKELSCQRARETRLGQRMVSRSVAGDTKAQPHSESIVTRFGVESM